LRVILNRNPMVLRLVNRIQVRNSRLYYYTTEENSIWQAERERWNLEVSRKIPTKTLERQNGEV
jgi:hypothetical protein